MLIPFASDAEAFNPKWKKEKFIFFESMRVPVIVDEGLYSFQVCNTKSNGTVGTWQNVGLMLWEKNISEKTYYGIHWGDKVQAELDNFEI